MSYLGLIAICLGLLSLVIALKFLNVLKSIDSKLHSKNLLHKECRTLQNIKSKSGLTMSEIEHRLLSSVNVVDVVNGEEEEEEGFKNYRKYGDRGGIHSSQLTKTPQFKKHMPNILERSKQLLQKSFPAILSSEKCGLFSKGNFKNSSKKWCLMEHRGKKYCQKSTFDELCPGKLVLDKTKCDIF